MIIDDYLGEKGEILYKAWRRNEFKDRDFLHQIYSSINRNEAEILEDILRIEWDETADYVIDAIHQAGGDFIILSAGTSYYIERLLEHKGLQHIKVYSNPGEYREYGIHLSIDETSPFFSDIYGIDKSKVLTEIKKQYDYVYYAGDSAPDIPPCTLADTCFAKSALQEMLHEKGIPFIPMTSYKDIGTVLKAKGVIV